MDLCVADFPVNLGSMKPENVMSNVAANTMMLTDTLIAFLRVSAVITAGVAIQVSP